MDTSPRRDSMEAKMILQKTNVSFVGAVLTIFSALLLLGAMAILGRVTYCTSIVDNIFSFDGKECKGSMDTSTVVAYGFAMFIFVIVTSIHLFAISALWYGVSKEEVSVIHFWSGVYPVLTAFVTNVPMMGAILCFVNVSSDNPLVFVGSSLLVVAFLHFGLMVLFSINLKFHYENKDDDSSPFANNDISVDNSMGPVLNGIELSEINAPTDS